HWSAAMSYTHTFGGARQLGAATVLSGIKAHESSALDGTPRRWFIDVHVSVAGSSFATLRSRIDPSSSVPSGSSVHGASPIALHTRGGEPGFVGEANGDHAFATGS